MRKHLSKKDAQWKVLCLGLDGATMDLILPWVREGKLPTFKHLIDRGSCGELESVVQPCSAQAWTSFMTGKNPGKHGIFGFRKQILGSYKQVFANGGMVASRSIWDIMSEGGRDVLVMNVPMTYPPKPVKGCLISGMDAPGVDCEFTYPKELKEELMDITGGEYLITVHLGGHLTSDKKRRDALDRLMDMADRRTEAALHFMRTRPWDFAMVKFDIPDQAHHYFWKYLSNNGDGPFEDAICQVYRKLDAIVQRFLDEIDDQTILVLVSDHGGGPHSGKAVYVNDWLRRNGLLKARHEQKKGSALGGGRTMTKLPYQVIRWLYFSVLLKYLPDRAKDLLARRLPKLRSELRHYLKFSFLDWSRTKAYLGGNLDVIHINVKGREPEGVVEPGEEYERVRDTIVSGLMALKDPETGRHVFERIYKREEVYEGANLKEAPDLLLVPREYAYSLSRDLLEDDGEPLISRKKHHRGISGIHRMNGIVFFHGGPIKEGGELGDAKIVDLAPTILHLVGLAVPDDMDGRVVEEALVDSGIVEYAHGIDGGGGPCEGVYTEEEADAIRARLQGLGYIE